MDFESNAGNELAFSKVIAAASSFVMAGAGCWVARRLEQGRGGDTDPEPTKCNKVLIFSNTFAAGILLGAGLVHMLPKASKALEGVSNFPWAPAIAGCTIVFLVVIGEVAGACMPARDVPHSETGCAAYTASFAILPRRELMPPHRLEDKVCAVGTAAQPATQVVAMAADQRDDRQSQSIESGHVEEGSLLAGGLSSSSLGDHRQRSVRDPEEVRLAHMGMPGHSCHSHSSCCRVHRHTDVPCTTVAAGSQYERLHHGLPILEPSAEEPGALPDLRVPLCHVRASGLGPIAELKSFLLFFALCFHSVMEGLGMGSARESGLLFSIAVAVLTHKGLAAFALGCSLTLSDLSALKFWIFVFIFSAGTPLGCIAGALSAETGDSVTRATMSAICIAASSGTFIQVSCMELLPRAFAGEQHRVIGCLGFALGFAGMSSLAIWC